MAPVAPKIASVSVSHFWFFFRWFFIDWLATASGLFATFGNWLKNLAQYFKPITVCVYFALLYDWFISLSSFVMIDYIGITSVSKTGDRGEEGFRQRGGMGAFCLVLLCRDITPS